jgi:glycosyltransferase involved in cell wall biosynthesis
MAQLLADTGLEVHIVTTDDDGHGRLPVPIGEPVRRAAVTYWFFSRQTRFYKTSWPLTRWLASNIRTYDLVHIHALFSYTALPAAFYARRRAVPYIVRPLGTLNRYGMQQRRARLKRLSFHFIERHILKHAALVHYTSAQEQLEAAELGVISPADIIPNPVDEPKPDSVLGVLRERHPWLDQRKIILFLSRLDPKKGLDLLLPAFAQLRSRHPHAALVIAGEGEAAYVQRLKDEAARLDIADDILWTGFLAGAEKQAALIDADIFVLPSYSENFGNVVVEAMACGLPVVVSDQVGIQQDILEAQAGLVVSCDVTEIAAALYRLLAATDECRKMSARGRFLFEKKYSHRAVRAQLLAMYKRVLKLAAHKIRI